MKFIRRGLQLFCLFGVTCSFLAAQTPEAALEEMATSDKVEVVLRHLPARVKEALDTLSPQERAKITDSMLPARLLAREKIRLTKSEDGSSWEFTVPEGDGGFVKIQNTFLSGNDALVMVRVGERPAKSSSDTKPGEAAAQPGAEAQPKRREALLFLVMRLDDGEWRLINMGAAMEQQNLESEEFIKVLMRQARGPGHSDNPAVGVVRWVVTNLNIYAKSYPEIGFPPRVQALSGPPDGEASADHAMLIDPMFLEDPLIVDGYEFRYTRSAPDHFRLIVIPVEYGKGGTVSFFTDETGVIRSTDENRTPNENDKPLD